MPRVNFESNNTRYVDDWTNLNNQNFNSASKLTSEIWLSYPFTTTWSSVFSSYFQGGLFFSLKLASAEYR